LGIRFRTANRVAKMVTSSKGTPTDDTMDTLASLVGHGVQKPYCSKYLGKHAETQTHNDSEDKDEELGEGLRHTSKRRPPERAHGNN
jgi:hypothetical protein